MAFTVFLYNFSKKENSTAQPTGGVSFSCVLKDDSAILNPILLFNIGTETFPTSYNYAYIPSYNRYYWISEWTWIEGIWKAALTVDVLASWKSYIGNTRAYILRAASDFNENIPDTQFPMTGETRTIYSLGVNPWTGNLNGGSYIVGIIGKQSITVGAVSYYVFSQTQFRALCNYLFGSPAWLNITTIEENALKAQFNPFQYIVSCNWFPFQINTAGATNVIRFGWWDIMLDAGTMPSLPQYRTTISFPITKHPQTTNKGAWVNISPYTEMMLFVPPFGWMQINPQDFYTSDMLYCEILVDLISGLGMLAIAKDFDELGGSTRLAYYFSQVSVPIQLSQISTDIIGAAGSVINGVLGDRFDLGRIGNGIGNAIQSLIPKSQSIGANVGFTGFNQLPRLSFWFHTIASDYRAAIGRPYCDDGVINSFSGYLLCNNAVVSAPATSTELESISSFLNNGFYYE